jgi:hydrogenase maturation protein HypF
MAAHAPGRAGRARLGIRVRGTVQGVGFRPWIYRLALSRDLAGFVRNDSDGVWIEIEGAFEAVHDFPRLLGAEAPPLSAVGEVEVAELPLREDEFFRVVTSERGPAGQAAIPVDAATCGACLHELFDPGDRRFRYPFINCTDCGPRYTIVRDTPYDRARTTMSVFPLCAACRREYEDPSDRRFHAEPNACPDCGPRLERARHGFPPLFGGEALRAAAADLSAGRIVAVKGLGGFHLAADAADDSAVALLRRRKHRPSKPFAVMVRNLHAARRIAEIPPAAARALQSPGRPIVLVPIRPGAALSPGIAPGLTEIGVLLPYTPLHHLLLADGPPLLVMTSGNRSEEPIARENGEAREKLSEVADAFLLHDREIHTRADDSVLRISAGGAQPVRRSRGSVPEPIALPFSSPPVLAVGAELKNTVCVTRGNEAFLSPHVGDLGNPEAARFFEEVVGKLERLLDVAPSAVAHDLHPDYFSTRWAMGSRRARVPVQHHHAHIASCLAENGRTGPAIGIAFDGTGCGPAGELWGGEILIADLSEYRRVGHLRALRLPGGEAAIREPWRVAAAALLDAGEDLDLLGKIDARRREGVRQLLEKKVRTPSSTGAGRWFDAVAALCGFSGAITYEGQAAAELEAAATPGEAPSYRFRLERPSPTAPFAIDLRPLVREIARDLRGKAGVPGISARFHETLARAVAESSREARRQTGLRTVAFSGGCFQNRLLTERAGDLLAADGFEVLLHRRVPPNDGGLALGQAAVAAFRLRERTERN